MLLGLSNDLTDLAEPTAFSAFPGFVVVGDVQFCVVAINDNNQPFGIRIVVNTAKDNGQGTQNTRYAVALQIHIGEFWALAEDAFGEHP